MHHHGAGLRRLLKAEGREEGPREELIAALGSDHRRADISAPDRAMLDYALLLTRRPFEIDDKEILRLREQGFDDRAIHDICAITAYFAFVNRIADGLGVELEEA